MNSLLKLWKPFIKDAGSKYAKTHGILSEQQDGVRFLRSIHFALASIIIIIIEDDQIHDNDIYIMCSDLNGVFNATDDRLMFKHIR
jgi:hypothetical protein